MEKGKRIFLSGGAGFIGTALAERLINDHQLLVFDTLDRDSLSSRDFAKHPNLRMIQGDVQDLPALKEAMQGCQIVIHLAGVAGVDTVIKNPAHTMHVNMAGTANMLEAARSIGTCERFLNFSTSEVFGNYSFKASEADWTSAGAVGEARWTYAVSKLAGEHLTYAYFHQYKLPTVTVRPFNIYGPGQVGEGAIHAFVKRALVGEPLEVHGDGNQIRAWTYIDDMVEGIFCCLQRDEAIGKAFNIGNPKGTVTIFHLAELIKRLADSKSEVKHVPKNYTDIELRVPNIGQARELINFEPKVSLEEGILKTIEWYKNS